MPDVPEKLRCKICSELCKRGVRLSCCNTIACRACATKRQVMSSVECVELEINLCDVGEGPYYLLGPPP